MNEFSIDNLKNAKPLIVGGDPEEYFNRLYRENEKKKKQRIINIILVAISAFFFLRSVYFASLSVLQIKNISVHYSRAEGITLQTHRLEEGK